MCVCAVCVSVCCMSVVSDVSNVTTNEGSELNYIAYQLPFAFRTRPSKHLTATPMGKHMMQNIVKQKLLLYGFKSPTHFTTVIHMLIWFNFVIYINDRLHFLQIAHTQKGPASKNNLLKKLFQSMKQSKHNALLPTFN